jgi:hypothetical protein
MDMEWGIDVLSAQWRIAMTAPAIFGAAIVLGLFFGWGAAWLILHGRLAIQKVRLDDYRDEISKFQRRLTAAAAGDLVDRSELRLLIHGDEREPTLMFYMNISRWYFLRQVLVGIDKETGERAKHVAISLFVSFDQPTKVKILEVKSDAILPRYEVKAFNDRFAIIVFSAPIPAGTLEIATL